MRRTFRKTVRLSTMPLRKDTVAFAKMNDTWSLKSYRPNRCVFGISGISWGKKHERRSTNKGPEKSSTVQRQHLHRNGRACAVPRAVEVDKILFKILFVLQAADLFRLHDRSRPHLYTAFPAWWPAIPSGLFFFRGLISSVHGPPCGLRRYCSRQSVGLGTGCSNNKFADHGVLGTPRLRSRRSTESTPRPLFRSNTSIRSRSSMLQTVKHAEQSCTGFSI